MKLYASLVLVSMCLWACGAESETQVPVVADATIEEDVAESPEWATWPTDALGPYGVGYREVTITYTPPAYDGERTLTVGLWYPTDDAEGEEVAYMGIIPDVDGVLGGASLAEPHWEDGLYPVHLHSHGNMGYVGTSANLMAHFASHGWVSVAPEHVGNTLGDFISPRPSWMYYVRGHDLTATLDQMETLPPDDPLAGKLALGEVALSGHSFGGFTAYGTAGATFDMEMITESCATGEGAVGECDAAALAAYEAGVADDRVVSAMILDGGNPEFYGETGYESITVPILQMLAVSADGEAHGASDVIWPRLQTLVSTRVEALGGCHQTFSVGGCSGLSDEDGFALVNAYTLAFARHTLLGDEGDEVSRLLSGAEAYSDHGAVSLSPPAQAYWADMAP